MVVVSRTVRFAIWRCLDDECKQAMLSASVSDILTARVYARKLREDGAKVVVTKVICTEEITDI